MRVSIRDRETLSQLRPLDLAAYLRTKGWRERERATGRYAVWTQGRNGDCFELMLPLDAGFRDYALRIGDLLRTLEQVEKRSQLAIFADVATSFADRIRVRAHVDGNRGGSIGLDTGLELVRNSRELMLAAACAAIEPRPHYPTRRPDQAMRYLGSLELGQTEAGSFVVTIISPVPPALQAPEIEEHEPFERRVIRFLIGASTAAREAAEEAVTTGSLGPFRRAVEHGVSANLCDALAGIQEASGGDRFELGVSWATARRPPTALPSSTQITRDAAEVLREASRLFKESEAREELEIEGYVIALKRDEGSETGTITVSGLVDGALRKIRIDLADAAYQRAIEAHREERPVSCEGQLVREGRSFALQDPHSFRIASEN